MRHLSILSLAFVVPFLAACGSEYPDESPGNRVKGKIIYFGTAHEQIKNPGLGIMAYAEGIDPATGVPHAASIFPEFTFVDHAFSYELTNLAPYVYVIVGTILNLDDTSLGPRAGGQYAGNNGKVTVTDAAPTANIDVVLFDLRSQDERR